MTHIGPIIRVYFKVAGTSDSSEYDINVGWTTEQFINIIREKVVQDFNLENVEFVDTENNFHPRQAAEDGPALKPSNITLIEKYRNKIYQLAFYIRPISLIAMDVSSEEELPETNYLHTNRSCAICMIQERNVVFVPCNHLCACEECSFNQNITVCPICRTAFTNRMVVFV